MNHKRDKIVFSVPIYIEKDNSEYHAFCPVLKGLHTRGNTLKEVKENAGNAVTAYINSLIKHGDPIPLCLISEEIGSKGKRLKDLRKHSYIYSENLIEVTI